MEKTMNYIFGELGDNKKAIKNLAKASNMYQKNFNMLAVWIIFAAIGFVQTRSDIDKLKQQVAELKEGEQTMKC